MMRILITNDDGYTSSGIIRLAEAASQFGEVWVVAPDGQRSAASHSITLRHSVDVWRVDFPVDGVKAFACNGTPADCARIGILNIVKDKPDWVFSGINYGYNLASDLQYSATVGAAFEASFQKIPAIAFSESGNGVHEVTDKYLEAVIKELIETKPEQMKIWNVNFPGCSLAEFNGILRNRIVSNDRFFIDSYEETPISEGIVSYMVKGILDWSSVEGSDKEAVINNYISIGSATNIS